MSSDLTNTMHDAALKALYSGATSYSFFFQPYLTDT